MNIFENSYLNVKEHNYMKSGNMDKQPSLMQVYENMQQSKKVDDNETKLNKLKQERKEKEMRGAIGAAASLESYLGNLTEILTREGKEILFRDYMADLFLESVYIDDDFKYTHAENIRSVMYEYLDKNKGYGLLEAACKKQPENKFLKRIKSTIDKHASKCSKRKTKMLREACEGEHKGEKAMDIMNQKYRFTMMEEEARAYMAERENLSQDEIAELVKNKVLDVVKDESEKQREAEAFEDEMKEMTKDMTGTAKKAVEESYRARLNNNAFSDASLFEALNANSMKEIVQESTGDDEINMDLVMCESIVKYTLLELTYTMKLESYNRNEIQTLCHKLMK